MEARIDPHPPVDSLKAFSLGLLDDASARALFLHLEKCPPCRRRAEEASGDDFLARLQKARASNSTPAPPRQLPPLPGLARDIGHASTVPPDPERSLGSSLLDPSSTAEAGAVPAAPSDVPPELAANAQYEVIRELDRGGMGVVYLARNKQMGRLEVLKVVNSALLERPGTAERFLREIRSAAALEHRNVVRAYTYLQAGKLLALVMEYVEGEDLARLVERRGPLSVPSACASIVQAARGLQEAHGKGMVHRDIKPQNLLLSRRLREVMILDFGLAKVASEKGVEQGLTAEGKMLGTPAYVAPEQIRDASTADIRADIYSLGCTLYYLLSGHPPFEAPNLFALLHAHQFTDAEPLDVGRPNVPPALAAVVARMMAKDPAKRYQRPADVAAALTPFVKGGKPSAPPVLPKPTKQEAMVTTSVPPLPPHVQVELVPAPAVERAPFDLEDLPAPAVSRKRKKNRGALAAVALALLVPLAVGIAIAVLRVETPNGTLIVEIKDPDVELRFKGGELILTGPDGKERYRLSAKDRSKKLDAGEYLIRVEGADGLALDTPEFVMKKGGVITVRVTLRPPTPDSPPSPKKGDTITNSIGMKLAFIPAGKFRMGSPKDEKDRERNGKGSEEQHEVEITKAFYMGVYAVTQGEYEKVTGQKPSWFSASGGGRGKVGDIDTTNFPVESLSWYQAKEFCDKLSVKEKAAGRVYRLPTEAEWEYACRAGTTTPFHFGTSLSSTQANFAGRSPYGGGDKGPYLAQPCKVGSYRPNAWGLHDMHGNVRQWCADWFDPDYYGVSPRKDPKGGSDKSGQRVIRGGGWPCDGSECRSADRFFYPPGRGGGTDCYHVGFRVVMVPSGSPRTEGVIEPKANLDPDRKAAEFVPLFNGKDLTGWEGVPGLWHFDKGILVGTTAEGLAYNTCLCSKQKYKDFELRFKVRIKNGNGNSGVQIRSTLVDSTKYTVKGPQCDMGDDYWGSLWGEQFGGMMKAAPKEVVDKVLKKSDFNDYYIKVVGKHVTIKLNGEITVDDDFPTMPDEGVIGWQLHGKYPGQEVTFKDIQIAEEKFAVSTPWIYKSIPPSAALVALTRDKLPPEALALAGDGDPKRAPASLVGVLGEVVPFHTDAVRGLAYSPDGKWLASASSDKTIHLRDAGTGTVKRVLKGHTAAVSAVAFSKDGKTLASASFDGDVKLWPVDKEGEPQTVKAGIGEIQSMTASPDGRFLAVGGANQPIKLWKWGAWDKATDLEAVKGRAGSLSFSPNGATLASSWDGVVRLYDTATGKATATWPVDGSNRVLAFHRDGKRLVSTGGLIKIWDVATGKQLVQSRPGAEPLEYNTLALHPDGKIMYACNGGGLLGQILELNTFNYPSEEKMKAFREPNGIWVATYSPSGKLLAFGTDNGGVHVWNFAKGEKQLPRQGHSRYVHTITVGRDGRTVLTGGDDNAVRRWDVSVSDKSELLEKVPLLLHHVAFSPDGKKHITSDSFWDDPGRMGIVWDSSTNKQLFTVDPRGKVFKPVFSPDGKHIAGCNIFTSSLHLWDPVTGKQLHRFPPFGHTADRPAFSHEGKLVAVASVNTRCVRVYDVKSGEEVAGWTDDRPMCAHALSPDGRLLAAGHEDGAISLWEVAEKGRKKLRLWEGHSGAITRLMFTPDGKTMISSGSDGTLRLWTADAARSKEVIGLGPPRRPLTFDLDPSGKYVFAAGQFPVIFILRLP